MKTARLALALLLVAAAARAGQTRRFVADTPATLAGATAVGVAVGRDGTLRPLPPLVTVAELEEPLGLALAVTNDDVAFVGTGHPARVWRIDGDERTLIAEVEADQVTALLLSPNGDLYVATAVPAALIRVGGRGSDQAELVAHLNEGNIWDLAWFGDELIAAAGNPGRLLRLTPRGLELAASIPDQHARCLAVSGDTLLIGTSGRGLVLRWPGRGPVGAFYDTAFTEVADLAVGPDGRVYAAALTGDPTLGKSPKEGGKATVTVSSGGESPPPQADGGTATAEILRISPQGAAITLHRFTRQLAGALAWSRDALVVGTGVEGEIWQLVDGAAAELDTVDAAQVTALAAGGDWVLTQGPVRLMHRVGAPRGTVVSPVLDAEQPSRWGVASISVVSDGGECTVGFRSGATAEPDETWSSWSDPRPCATAQADAPLARFLQWRLDLASPAGRTLRVRAVEVAYSQVNLAPQIAELTVHAPGEVYLKTPPPSDRVVEVEHPDLSGIFTTLDDDGNERQARLGKLYYRVGYQTVSWQAEDANKDPLRFTVEVQREGAADWWTIREALSSTVLSFDTQALADGRYRVRLTASDEPLNPAAPGVASRLSSWFVVDNTPPSIAVRRDGATWVVTASDALSPLTVVEWSRDAAGWHGVLPEDGLLDGRREVLRIPASPGRHLLAVRVVDDHHNRATVAVEEQP